MPLPGGQGTSWRAGPAVLKPLDGEPAGVAWQAGVLGRLAGQPDLRVSLPLRALDGGWALGGWTAWRFEPGAAQRGRWLDMVAVGERLHAALADEPEPALLAARTDRWAVADRVVWGELAVPPVMRTEPFARGWAALRPVGEPRQLVHGDLAGNVLFHDDLPPLVIDLSPYWRPPTYAAAMVVADALVFEGAGVADVEPVLDRPGFAQCLLRAVLFRAVTDYLAGRVPGERYRTAVELALRLGGHRST